MPPQSLETHRERGRVAESCSKAPELTDITVEKKNVGYYLESAEQWWDIVWNAGFRRMMSRLTPDDQERFKQEHLREVELLRTEKGIWLDVGVLYTTGTRRGS